MQEHETSLLQELSKKKKQAVLYNTKRSFPLSMFHSYDPFLAAELFQEIADAYFSLNKYIDASIYYLNSAEAYLSCNDPGSKSYAAHVYVKLAELYNTKSFYNPEKAVEYYNNAAFYFSVSGSFSLAASKKLAVAKINNLQFDFELAATNYKEAIDLYDKAKMPANKVLLYDDYACILVKAKKYKEAGEFLLEISSEKSFMCTFYLLMSAFCFFVVNEENETSDHLMGEEKDVYDSMNDLKTFEKRLNDYLSKKKFRTEYLELLDEVKTKLQPEYNIL